MFLSVATLVMTLLTSAVDINLIPNAIASDYEVRMGGGDDALVIGVNGGLATFDKGVITESFLSLDGEVLANDGDDLFIADGVLFSEVVGRGGNDVIDIFLLDNSEVNGNTGNDRITVRDTVDSEIYGGQGNDTLNIQGPSVESTIYGNKGIDTIVVGDITGAAFNGDTISYTNKGVAFGDTAIYGGQGDDDIDVNSNSNLFVSGDLGSDNIFLGNGDNTVLGEDGNDTIIVGSGKDDVEGGKGNDVIATGGGVDKIAGGEGKDFIAAGKAGDTYSGGSGDDVFEIAAKDSNVKKGKSSGFDFITDFTGGKGNDVIDLDFAINAVTRDTISPSGGADLYADLNTLAYTANAAKLVSITGPVDWAGKYIVASANNVAAGADLEGANVIRVSSIDNIVADNFVV